MNAHDMEVELTSMYRMEENDPPERAFEIPIIFIMGKCRFFKVGHRYPTPFFCLLANVLHLFTGDPDPAVLATIWKIACEKVNLIHTPGKRAENRIAKAILALCQRFKESVPSENYIILVQDEHGEIHCFSGGDEMENPELYNPLYSLIYAWVRTLTPGNKMLDAPTVIRNIKDEATEVSGGTAMFFDPDRTALGIFTAIINGLE